MLALIYPIGEAGDDPGGENVGGSAACGIYIDSIEVIFIREYFNLFGP